MKAEITFSQLYWNNLLMDFFFRQQSKNTLDELMKRVDSPMQAIEFIDSYVDDNEIDADELDEIFYNDSIEDIAAMFGIELNEESDNEEE